MDEIKMVIGIPRWAGVYHIQLELILWDSWQKKIEKQKYTIKIYAWLYPQM